MNIALLLIIFFIIFIIAEIGTIALKLTGLNIETARFQAISLITNTGFTTSESELIVRNNTRKRIAAFLMVTFYISLPLIIATVLETLSTGFTFINLLIIAIGLVLSYSLMRNRRFIYFIEKTIERYLIDYNVVKQSSLQEIFSLDSDYKIIQVIIENRQIIGKPLSQLALQNHEIIILAIERGSELIKRSKGHHTLELGDRVLLYGKLENIKKIFGCYEGQCLVVNINDKY